MNFPLISLAAISVVVGFMGTGLMHHALLKYITPQAHGEFSMPMALTGTSVALAGLIGAYWVYLKKQAQPPQTAKGIRKVLDQKYYMDFLFEKVFGRAILALSAFFNWFDKQMINAKMVNGTAWNTFRLGGLLSKIQTGELQDYLMILFFIGSALIFFLIKF
jgi:NADH-quinone oxidoreductase subunit L